MENKDLQKEIKGNEIKSLKLYDFVLFGVYELKDKIELNFIESRKNEWNGENSIVKLINKGLSGKCVGLIMKIGEGMKIKEDLEIGFGRMVSVDSWKWYLEVPWFKGYVLKKVKIEGVEELRVVGKLFKDVKDFVNWCKDDKVIEIK